MTTLIFSTGGCPSYPFIPLKGAPGTLFSGLVTENPSREVATKDHSSSNPRKGNPPDLKTKVDVSKVDVKGFPTMALADLMHLDKWHEGLQPKMREVCDKKNLNEGNLEAHLQSNAQWALEESTWRTFRIFFIFSARGRGRESPRRQEGGRGRFLLKIPGGGVLPGEAAGGRGAGRASAGIRGGGGG